MEYTQLFSKPTPPNNGISLIYPKRDWYWYYVNTDWKEQRIIWYDYFIELTEWQKIVTTWTTTLTQDDNVIFCDLSWWDIDILLPEISTLTEKRYEIKRLTDDNTKILSIIPFAWELLEWLDLVEIEDTTSLTIKHNWINWFII